jgi:hypothetical protein
VDILHPDSENKMTVPPHSGLAPHQFTPMCVRAQVVRAHAYLAGAGRPPTHLHLSTVANLEHGQGAQLVVGDAAEDDRHARTPFRWMHQDGGNDHDRQHEDRDDRSPSTLIS